jgi:arylsulfatase A-like enzyme
MLLYLDDVLGRLFEAVTSSGLADSTYIMLTADNGPALSRDYWSENANRLVSGTHQQG